MCVYNSKYIKAICFKTKIITIGGEWERGKRQLTFGSWQLDEYVEKLLR